MDNLKLPLFVVIAVAAQVAGAVFYGANIIRDVQDNTDRTEALLEVLLETERDLEEVDEEQWTEFEALPRLMTDLIRLQARVAVLEKTMEFSRKDGM
tara:strand:- start:646 stop:936 length:291 start_codon:yes stop_codon:yes gene_type:complete